jgi:hypothetical protein
MMKAQSPSKYRNYAIASIACPVLAFIGTYLYQSITYAEFWTSLTPGQEPDNVAGAMMALSEAVQMIFALTIGCLLGFILALRSLQLKQWKFGIGTIAMCLNGLPLIFLVFLWARGIAHGL